MSHATLNLVTCVINSPSLQHKVVQLCGIGNVKIKTLENFEMNIECDRINFSITFHVVPEEAIPIGVIVGNEFMKMIV